MKRPDEAFNKLEVHDILFSNEDTAVLAYVQSLEQENVRLGQSPMDLTDQQLRIKAAEIAVLIAPHLSSFSLPILLDETYKFFKGES